MAHFDLGPDLAPRIAEVLNIPLPQAELIAGHTFPVFVVQDIAAIPSTRVTGPEGTPSNGFIIQAGAGAVFSHNQLFNPAGSGVDLHVDQAVFGVGLTDGVEWGRHDTALTTLGTGKGFRDLRKRGNPVAEVRSQNIAVATGAFFGTIISEVSVAQVIQLGPLIIPPGAGLISTTRNVNITLRTWWLWREVTR